MSGEKVNEVVKQVLQIEELDVETFTELLGTELEEVEKNPEWTFFDFKVDLDPFTHGEVHISVDPNRAHISLWPGEESAVVEDDLDLDQWGEVEHLGINPRIPPEGTVSFLYLVNGARVIFQIMYESRRLRCLVIEWGEEEI